MQKYWVQEETINGAMPYMNPKTPLSLKTKNKNIWEYQFDTPIAKMYLDDIQEF